MRTFTAAATPRPRYTAARRIYLQGRCIALARQRRAAHSVFGKAVFLQPCGKRRFHSRGIPRHTRNGSARAVGFQTAVSAAWAKRGIFEFNLDMPKLPGAVPSTAQQAPIRYHCAANARRNRHPDEIPVPDAVAETHFRNGARIDVIVRLHERYTRFPAHLAAHVHIAPTGESSVDQSAALAVHHAGHGNAQAVCRAGLIDAGAQGFGAVAEMGGPGDACRWGNAAGL